MGEVVSGIVADAIITYWRDHADKPDRKEKVEQVCRKAHAKMDKRAFSLGHIEMGTTMVMADLESNKVTIASSHIVRRWLFQTWCDFRYRQVTGYLMEIK